MTENKTTVTFDEHKAVLAKNTALETENMQLRAQLDEATAAMKLIKAEHDEAEKTERINLINDLHTKSKGKLALDMLDKQTKEQLYVLKNALDVVQPETFASVLKQRELDAKSKIHGTVGSYNQQTGKYEGGLPE